MNENYKTKIIMKKRFFLITLIGMSFGMKAQITELSNGNVGIGTITPSHIFHIKTAGAVGLFESTTNQAYLRLQTNEGFGKRVEFTNRPGGRAAIWVSGASDAFNVLANGNVGIGTITPDSKLSVNGKIHAKEVKIDLIGWSDFVFEDDYKLPTLKDVEKHIKEKGHLKDIPSAKKVEKNGIFLGEMNSKLLQKIEELTLYTIQQEKEIVDLNKLKSKVQTLEKENESLKFLATKFLELQKRLEKLEKK
jgi:hypothetical protein